MYYKQGGDTMKYREKMDTNNSICVDIPDTKKGEVATINYSGQLTEHKNEKGDIYMHYGFDGWNKVSTISMDKVKEDTYAANIYVSGKREIDICFKDGAGHWDNNDGSDYKIEIHY